MDKYPKHVIDYAIDNKVSLEEAYNHFIMNGEEKKEEPIEIDREAEEKFLSELEEKIKADTDDEQWWAEWQDKIKKIEEMERELGVERDDVITKEEFDWVDAQLEEYDKLYEEMYRKDL